MARKDLPLDKGSRICEVFESLGLVPKGLSDKNHYILVNPRNPYVYISIPNHDEVDRNTLKAEIRKAGKKDADFIKAYESRFGRHATKPAVVELEACCLCHELIKPEDETVVFKENGLSVHKACHDARGGTPLLD